MPKKIRLGYDILAKRAIETESGVNIDEAIKGKLSVQKVAGTGTDSHPDVVRPNTEIIYLVKSVSSGSSETYKQWMWTQPAAAEGYWECVSDNTDLSDIETDIENILADSDYIYLDSVNGDDTNNGLTKNTAVRTMAGAAEAFRLSALNNNKFNVYILSSTTIGLPRDEMLKFMSSPNLYVFGDTISLEPSPYQGTLHLNYPIFIEANSSVTLNLYRQSDYCTGDISVKSGNSIFLQWVETTGNIVMQAKGDIEIGGASSSVYFASVTLSCKNLNSSYAKIVAHNAVDIRAANNISLDGVHGSNINLDAGGTLTVRGSSSVFGFYGINSTENTTIATGMKDVNNNISNFTTGGNAYLEGDKFSIGGSYEITGDFTVKCNAFTIKPGSNTFHGNLNVYAEDNVEFGNGGNIYVDGDTKIICNGDVNFSPTFNANYIEVTALGYCKVYTLLPRTSNQNTIHKYIFNAGGTMTDSLYTGAGCFETYYSGIQNPYADVVINCTGIVRLCKNNTAQYCRSLDIHAHDLVLYSTVYTGFFHIDIANQIEQSNPGCYIVMPLSYGTAGEDDYISYDIQSENSLKCGSLYCSIYYNSNSCGLIQPYYGSAVKNIDIQVDMVLAPSYNGSGAQTPFVLGPCRSGQGTFNSTISGHVGGYVGYNSPSTKISPWNHDVRFIDSTYLGTSNYPNPNNATYGIITLKFDDVYETNHFYFDPAQGNDALDGCTRQTAVKTTSALVRCMMKKANGSYNSETNTFSFPNGISIHILSVDANSMYTSYEASSWQNLLSLSNQISDTSGLDFTFMYSYGGAIVSFNFVEFIPEAPNMSLYVKGMVADVIQARGFYDIGLCNVSTKNSYYGIGLLDAVEAVSIYNGSSYGGVSFYSTRFNCLTIRARNICIGGMFHNLNAIAQDNLYVYDTTGAAAPSSETNCCIAGLSKLEAKDIYLGGETGYGYKTYSGIAGACSIKAHHNLTTYVDSFTNAVCDIVCGDYIQGVFGSGYFRGRLTVKCNYCNWGADSNYYSFNTYDSASAGGAGIIDINANNSISMSNWGSTGSYNYLYGIDLRLHAHAITGSQTYIYGNNGSGSIVISTTRYLAVELKPYYYNSVTIKSPYVYAPLHLYGGGSWGPSTQSQMTLLVDIGQLQQPIRLYTSRMSSYQQYCIRGHIDNATCKIIDWGQVIDPDNPPTITPPDTFKFELVVGHSTVEGHGIDKTGWIPADSGSVIVLNDSKQLVAGTGITISDTGDNVVVAARNDMPLSTVEIPVVIDALDTTHCTASLFLNKYNIITGLTDTITDLEIILPTPAPRSLREVGFEFSPVEGTQLENVTFSDTAETQYLPIMPDEYAYGCVYQGAVINRCVTLVEYGDPIEGLVIDGRTYRTVTMPDGNEWMAENLAASSFGGVCYNNGTDDSYGLYYTVEEVANISVPGWHVATIDEWNGLAESVNSDYAKLASTEAWAVPGTSVTIHGTDDYGFTLCPYGYGYSNTQQSLMWPPTGIFGVMWLSNGDKIGAVAVNPNPETSEFVAQVMTEVPSGEVYLQNVRLVKDK